MKPENEFFNLFVKRAEEYEGIFKDVCVSVITKQEVYQYFDYLKQKKTGNLPIGNKKVEIIEPQIFNIYDFSKYLINKPSATKTELIKAVNDRLKKEDNSEEVFSEFGIDVTDSFGIRLEDILVNSKNSNSGTITTSTATTKNERLNTKSESYKVEGSPIELTIHKKGDGQVNLDGSNPYIPNEFSGGIIDTSINPTFNVEKISRVFANHLIKLKHESGQMVGVFGKWGRGKTYFVNEVCKYLRINFEKETSDADSDFIFIKFQAWKYQTTPSTWAYLFETIIDKYLNVEWYNKPWRIIRFSLIRKGHWNTWVKPLLEIFLCAIWFKLIPYLTQNASIIETGKWAGGIGAMLIITNEIASVLKLLNKPAIKLFDSLTKIPSFKSVLGVQAEVQKELVFLIKAFSQFISNKRILLFIDDLDRCSEDSMIEIVDALRVILDDFEINKKIVVLVAVDESKLKKAIEFKYKERRKEDELMEISKEYIDKLFISALKLPPISSEKFGDFIESIANQVNYPNGKKIEVQLDDQINLSDEVAEDENQSTNPNEIQEKEKSTKSEPTIESTIKLTEKEIGQLKEKLSSISSELTPRQIRIVFFRYLLARNLWIELNANPDFEVEPVIDDIIKQTLSSDIDKNPEKNELYDEIVQMVVAY